MESKDFLMVVDASSMLTRGNPTHEDIMNCPWQWRRPFLDDKRRFRKRRVADGCFYDPVDPAFVDHLMPGPGSKSNCLLNVEEQSKVAQEIERLMAERKKKDKGLTSTKDEDEEDAEDAKCARCSSWGRSSSWMKASSSGASSSAASAALSSSCATCSCFGSSRKRVCRRSQSWSAQTDCASSSNNNNNVAGSQSESALMDSILVFSQGQQPDGNADDSASFSCSSSSSSSSTRTSSSSATAPCNGKLESDSSSITGASTPPANVSSAATATSPTSTATVSPFMDCLRLNDDDELDAQEQDGHDSSMLALVSDDYDCEQTYEYFAFADQEDLFAA